MSFIFAGVAAQLTILAVNLTISFRRHRQCLANIAEDKRLLDEMEMVSAGLNAFHAKIQADINEHGAILLPAPAGPTPICLN